jgi:hypothetical protein
MSDAEVMTTALTAALFFRGTLESARVMLKQHGYIPARVIQLIGNEGRDALLDRVVGKANPIRPLTSKLLFFGHTNHCMMRLMLLMKRSLHWSHVS